MTHTRSHRHDLPALLLAGVLLVSGGAFTVTLGADASSAPEGEATAAEGSAETEPTPEPTPYPAFDPSTVEIRTDLFVDGFESPVYVTDDGADTASDCLYVVERGGTIKVVEPDGFVRPRAFLDISDRVAVGAEQGLHSVAFHPGFAKNKRFFVHYNDRVTGDSVIEEYRGTACRAANPEAVKTLLSIAKPRGYPNNNAGWIGFGPDGFLYIPLGDGGGVSPGDPTGIGQSPTTRLSKVLRINVNKGNPYAIPKDNPYARKRKGGFPRETWAMGLRDPRRASFDRATGDLWIGDVGQDRFEEVDRVPKGVSKLNFGWSDTEGEVCHNLPDCDPTQYAPPVHFYDTVLPQRGIVGGYVYRGDAIPQLKGVYLFSDIGSGYIWGLDADAVRDGQPAVAHLLLDAPQGFVSFGEDDDGELYLVEPGGGIFRLTAEES